MTADGTVRLRSEAGVAWVTLDRPERLNALAGTMRDDLADRIGEAAAAPDVRVIVVTGAGRAFCAGADVDVMADLLDRRDEETFRGFVRAGARVVLAIRRAPQPVLAAVNGVAAGAGASLASACDLRLLSDTAKVGFTFNRIGLHPDWGATHFLPRLVGAGRAADLILSARLVGAEEAEAIGFAQHVLPSAEYADRVADIACTLAAAAPIAVRHAKASLGAADESLSRALEREEEAQMACFHSEDVREGLAAFRERRAPRFAGR